MLKRLRKLLFGVSAVESKNDEYDRQAVEVLRRSVEPDACTVDVGCHRGTFLDELLRACPRGKHHAFEPIPGLFEGLRQRYGKDPRVVLHECALAAAAGQSTFQHVVSNPAYSGLERRRYEQEETIETIDVRLATLDAAVGDAPVAFIKIDVEGGELGVLLGARTILARCKPTVVFEHGLGGADHYGTEPEQVFDVLDTAGLAVWTMERWLAGEPAYARAAFAARYRAGEDFYYMAAAPRAAT